jgi:hypothetical protein
VTLALPTASDAAETPEPSGERDWLALGRAIAAAHARDLAAEVSSWDQEGFARVVRSHLEPWLVGTARINYLALSESLSMATRGVYGAQVAEADAAVQWLTVDARLFMAHEALRAGGREVSFILTPQADGKYGEPVLSMRGNPGAVRYRDEDLVHPRSLLLHSHPTGDLSPSDADLVNCNFLLEVHKLTGFGIVSLAADRLYLVREPRPEPVSSAGPS